MAHRTRTRARVGVHLDGTTATVVTLADAATHPSLAKVHQATGFTVTDALVAVRRHVPPSAHVRVTVSAPGVGATALDLTPAALTREGFTTLAFRAFGDLAPTTAVAGVITDPDAVKHGQLQPGLAVCAPADLVTDTYTALAEVPHLDVTTTAVAAAALDGIHLALRRTTSEVTLVRDGRTVTSQLLHAGGLDVVESKLSHDSTRVTGTLAGHPGDPLATSVLDQWLGRVAHETRQVLHEWTIAGHRVSDSVHVHGRAATATAVDDQLAAVGLRRLPHPYAGLPHPAPLDAVDAYLAATTAGQHLPYATFPRPADTHPTTHGRSRRRLTAVAAAAVLTLTPAGYGHYQLTAAESRYAATVTGATDAQTHAVRTHQLTELAALLPVTGPDALAAAADLDRLEVTGSRHAPTVTLTGSRAARTRAAATISATAAASWQVQVEHGPRRSTLTLGRRP